MSTEQPDIGPESYTCAQCGGTFEKDPEWTDEDVLAEAEVHGFLYDPDPQNVVVCDDCFKQIMAANDHPVGERLPRRNLIWLANEDGDVLGKFDLDAGEIDTAVVAIVVMLAIAVFWSAVVIWAWSL